MASMRKLNLAAALAIVLGSAGLLSTPAVAKSFELGCGPACINSQDCNIGQYDCASACPSHPWTYCGEDMCPGGQTLWFCGDPQ